MSSLREPLPGNLTIAVMYRNLELLEKTKELLAASFGEIELESESYTNETLTAFYQKEMGAPIFKKIFSFKQLCKREDLKQIKLKTVEIEDFFKKDGKRNINIDPGLITLENFQLATGKNFAHRVYLGSGVFVEVTLQFTKDGIRKLDWTYADYLLEPANSFILKIREIYKTKIEPRGKK